jgi:WD40 repeat protein
MAIPPGLEWVSHQRDSVLPALAPPVVSGRTDVFGDPLPDGSLARLGTVRLRHGTRQMVEAITTVAVSVDGKTLASAGSDQTVRLWETATGRELHRLAAHKATVWAVTFTPDGKTLLSVGEDARLYLWTAGRS